MSQHVQGSCSQVEAEVLKVQTSARRAGHEITTEASVSVAVANLQAAGCTSMQMATDGRMENATRGFWGGVKEKKSLATVKADLAGLPAASRLTTRGYAAAAPVSRSNVLRKDLINHEQVSRMVQKAQCQDRLL